MGLITQTKRLYYAGSQQFVGDGVTDQFLISLDPQPTTEDDFRVFLDKVLQADDQYTFAGADLTFNTPPGNNVLIEVVLVDKTWGDYQYIPISDLINNIMTMYVGPGKILNRMKRRDIEFHMKRAIQEFSYDVSRPENIQEVELGPSLSIPFPQDAVELISINFVDGYGFEHPIPPGRFTSRPSEAILQDDEYDYIYDDNDDVVTTNHITQDRFTGNNLNDVMSLYGDPEYLFTSEYQNDIGMSYGERYGANPELMNSNGIYIIDRKRGTIGFSANLVGSLITIHYVTDGLGTDAEMVIHKMAEQAVYDRTVFEALQAVEGVTEYVLNRWRKKAKSSRHNAKIRLSALSPKELTPVLRNRSKHIKH